AAAVLRDGRPGGARRTRALRGDCVAQSGPEAQAHRRRGPCGGEAESPADVADVSADAAMVSTAEAKASRPVSALPEAARRTALSGTGPRVRLGGRRERGARSGRGMRK